MEYAARRGEDSAFGILLRRHRLAAGLSQEALAERAQLSPDAISALERGHRRSPQRATLALLAGALALEGEQREEFESASRPVRPPRRGLVTVGPWRATPAGSPANNIPQQVTPLIGRDEDIAKIVPMVREHSLVTLAGAGGVGKTRLALAVAESSLGAFEDGVWFVDLAPSNDPVSVARAIASTIGLADPGDRPLLDVALQYLKSRRLVLIIDNCEHLLNEAVRIIDALVRGARSIHVLATSREPLRVAAEHVYRVPSLTVPSDHSITADDAGRYGATALFAERASAANSDFALTDINTPFVAEICRRLDGIPLAIELAAARVTSLPPRQLMQRLDERFRLLAGANRMAVPRHQTMRAAIGWSYELLSPPEQRVFRRLAIFAGGWTLGAAETVCTGDAVTAADVNNAITSLETKSLIVADASEDSRYRFLESVRAFALEKLQESGEHGELAGRHARWVVEIGDLVDRAYETNVPLTAGLEDELEHDLENALAAIDWALANGEILVAMQAARGFARAFGFADRTHELRKRLMTTLERAAGKCPPEIAAGAWLAMSYVTPGVRGVEAARRALKLGKDANNPAFTAWCLNSLAWNFHRAGRSQDGEVFAERAVELLRKNGLTHSYEYADSLNTAATIALVCGQLGEALKKYRAAHALATAIGARDPALVAQINSAVVEFSKGNAVSALAIVRSVEAERRGRQLKSYDKTMLANAIAYCIALGDLREACRRGRELLSLSRGTTVHFGYAINGLATVAALSGDARRGARLRGYVHALFRREGLDPGRTEQFISNRLKSALRKSLSSAEIESLAAQGANLSEEQALAEVSLVA